MPSVGGREETLTTDREFAEQTIFVWTRAMGLQGNNYVLFWIIMGLCVELAMEETCKLAVDSVVLQNLGFFEVSSEALEGNAALWWETRQRMRLNAQKN